MLASRGRRINDIQQTCRICSAYFSRTVCKLKLIRVRAFNRSRPSGIIRSHSGGLGRIINQFVCQIGTLWSSNFHAFVESLTFCIPIQFIYHQGEFRLQVHVCCYRSGNRISSLFRSHRYRSSRCRRRNGMYILCCIGHRDGQDTATTCNGFFYNIKMTISTCQLIIKTSRKTRAWHIEFYIRGTGCGRRSIDGNRTILIQRCHSRLRQQRIFRNKGPIESVISLQTSLCLIIQTSIWIHFKVRGKSTSGSITFGNQKRIRS